MKEFVPCVQDVKKPCDYPRSCCLKKVHLQPIKADEFMTIPELHAIQGNPLTGWNVVMWNKAMPDKAICFRHDTEISAIRSFNTLVKMSSTLAACVRYQAQVKESYVWML